MAGASQAVLIKVRVQLANVRSGPDLGAAVVTQLKNGTLLEASGRKGDFYEVALADEAGRVSTCYIHANSVEVVSTPAETTAPPAPATAERLPVPERPALEMEPGPRRFGFGLTAGYALPSGYGGGIAYGGSLSYSLTSNLEIQVGAFRFQSAVDEPAEEDRENALSEGTLTVLPVELSLVVRFPMGPKMAPYLLAGAGYFLNAYKLDEAVRNGWESLGFAVEEKIKNSVGFHVGLGLDYFLSPKLAAGLLVKYGLSTAKGTWSIREEASEIEAAGDIKDIGLKPLVFGLSLRFFL
jgi:opacity protein-like surface antigen